MATRTSRDDLLAGAIFVAIGAFFAIEALNYDLGTLFKMGPGFMPLALGGALGLLGIAIVIKGFGKAHEGLKDVPSWRAIAFIVITILFFGFAIRGLGFVPTVFIGTALTAYASRLASPIGALILAVSLTILSTLVFVIGLRLSVPMFGPWLGL